MPVDEDEDVPCYRHPNHLTALRCSTCDRPICVDCAIAAPVGFKCPDHGRTSRAERGAVPVNRLVRGSVAAIATGVIAGMIVMAFNVPFLGFVLAWAGGAATGELAKRASGGYRDPALARTASIAAAIGIVVLPAAWLLDGSRPGPWLAFVVVQAAAAAWGAWNRAS